MDRSAWLSRAISIAKYATFQVDREKIATFNGKFWIFLAGTFQQDNILSREVIVPSPRGFPRWRAIATFKENETHHEEHRRAHNI
jgi:hypothetical protein